MLCCDVMAAWRDRSTAAAGLKRQLLGKGVRSGGRQRPSSSRCLLVYNMFEGPQQLLMLWGAGSVMLSTGLSARGQSTA